MTAAIGPDLKPDLPEAKSGHPLTESQPTRPTKSPPFIPSTAPRAGESAHIGTTTWVAYRWRSRASSEHLASLGRKLWEVASTRRRRRRPAGTCMPAEGPRASAALSPIQAARTARSTALSAESKDCGARTPPRGLDRPQPRWPLRSSAGRSSTRPRLPRHLDGRRPAGHVRRQRAHAVRGTRGSGVVHASGRARRDSCLSAHRGCPSSHDFARPFPVDQVRLTSIYSKGHGVVNWQRHVPHADCIEITRSHVGLVFNRKVYPAVAAALALRELPAAAAG